MLVKVLTSMGGGLTIFASAANVAVITNWGYNMRELTMSEFGFVSGGNSPPPSPPPSNQSTGSRAGGWSVGYDFRTGSETIYACQAPGSDTGGVDLSAITAPIVVNHPTDPGSTGSTFNTFGASNPIVLFFSLLFYSKPAR